MPVQQSSHSHKLGPGNYKAAMLTQLPNKFNEAIPTVTKQNLANAILTLSQASSNFNAEIITLSQSRF
jgi:hypothetical protein